MRYLRPAGAAIVEAERDMSDAPQGPGWWQASDGKYYPPQPAAGAAAPMATPPPPPPSGGGNGLKIVLGIVLVLFLLGGIAAIVIANAVDDVADDAVDSLNRTASSIQAQVDDFAEETGKADDGDYELADEVCAVEEIGGVQARGTFTNTSKEKQGFGVTVRFTTPDGDLISEDTGYVDALDPGQSTEYTVYAISGSTDGITAVECEITSVNYSFFDGQDTGN